MTEPLHVPRSVLLALWLSDGAPVPAVVRAVQGDDEPHDVRGVAEGDLVALLTRWANPGAAPPDVAAVLPAPGDPLAAPAAVSAAGIVAGELVLVRTPDGRSAALVPTVRRFGPDLEPGHQVTWQVTEVDDWRPALHREGGWLNDAERDLRDGLRAATEALTGLDVARWRPEAAAQVSAVRDGALPSARLPARLDGRRARVLASAARLRAIVALATQDDGGAVNLWQADQRSTALREVDRVARRAMGAAASWLSGDDA